MAGKGGLLNQYLHVADLFERVGPVLTCGGPARARGRSNRAPALRSTARLSYLILRSQRTMMLRCARTTFELKQDKLLRLWCHEESRVFRDRLISAEDRSWFNDALQVLMEHGGSACCRHKTLAAPEARYRALTVLSVLSFGYPWVLSQEPPAARLTSTPAASSRSYRRVDTLSVASWLR